MGEKNPVQAQFNAAHDTFFIQMASEMNREKAPELCIACAPLQLKLNLKFGLCNNMALSPFIKATSSWRSWACYCSQLTHFSSFSLESFPLVCVVTIPPAHRLQAGFPFVRPLSFHNPYRIFTLHSNMLH